MPPSPAKASAPHRELRTASQMPAPDLMERAKRKFPVWDDKAATELDKMRTNPPSMSTDAKAYALFLVLQDLHSAAAKRQKG